MAQGELLIKTALMIPGYFKHQEVNLSTGPNCNLVLVKKKIHPEKP